MNARTLMIAAAFTVSAGAATAAEPAADPTLGGLLAELRCTTQLESFAYSLEGQNWAWVNREQEQSAKRVHRVKLKEGTVCTGHDCQNAREFLVGQVTDRISYKELHLEAEETEYIIAIIGDATQPGAEILIEVKTRRQAKGQSIRTGVCEAI